MQISCFGLNLEKNSKIKSNYSYDIKYYIICILCFVLISYTCAYFWGYTYQLNLNFHYIFRRVIIPFGKFNKRNFK